MNIIHSLPPKTGPKDWVGIDSELYTNPGDVDHLHRPHTGKFACITISPNNTDVYFIDDETQVAEALSRVGDSVWCIQNAKFDLTHFRRWASVPRRKRLFDTMLVERIIHNGLFDKGGYSLQDLSRRYLLQRMDKSVRDEFEGASSFTPERIEYACKDALVTRQIALKQKELMDADDRHIWSDIDLPALWAFLDFKGFAVDVNKWVALAEKNLKMQHEIDEQLPFNPRSPKQVIAWMTAHGFKKLESSDDEHLTKAMQKWPNTEAAKIAKMVLDSKMYSTRASRYGLKMIEKYLEKDGDVDVLHPNYNIIGAETGRTSASDPSIQNIPARETSEYRECFIARPGNVLVIADYGAQEPRILAFVSQDEYLLECFNSGRDPYISLAKDAFGEEITKKDPRRKIYKDVVLGIGYGLSKYGLAEKFGISTDEAQTYITKASRILRGAAEWGSKQSEEGTVVHTPFGRKCYLNPYSGQVTRNARNAPIQGGAADMMKYTLGQMHQDWPFPFPFCAVGMVHDELIFDFPEGYAKEGMEFVQTYMEEKSTAMVNGQIRFIAEVYTGKTWAEKH